MKKKILFAINNLNCGGAENALVSLLQVIDHDKYEIDLFLFKKEGIFLNKLPAEVTLLDSPTEFQYFDMPIFNALTQSLLKLRFAIFFARIFSTYIIKTEKIATIRSQKLWGFLSFTLKKQPKKYDVAIGYLENFPNYYIIDKVNATKKIGFIRNDYQQLGMIPAIDEPYFQKFDKVLTVSESCAKILEKTFPQMPQKFGYMLSVFSPKTIQLMADEKINEDFSSFTIVTVGRLNAQKGYDLAIEASAILKQKGFIFKWYVLGIGEEKEAMKKLINQHQLQDNFILLGLKENPYPYVKNATIYAQTSRFEGKSRAIEEAKILQKPILVTNFPSVNDQITHLETGYIVPINAQAIADGILHLNDNKTIANQLTHNLQQHTNNNDEQLKVLYDLMD